MNHDNQNLGTGNSPLEESKDRRQALIDVAKFAAYAAPFTMLALTNKADAATGHGPPKH